MSELKLSLPKQEEIKTLQYEDQVVGLIDKMLACAIKNLASDVHIEPKKDFMDILFRIDGQFVRYMKLDKNIQNYLIRRIKILADLRIDENRLPQDGKVTFPVENKEVDFRVSLIPTVYGENMVIRILSKNETNITLENIGFSKPNLERIKIGLKQINGLILSSGPTGSGKSTTLFSILKRYNPTEANIATLEDPIEYLIPDAKQTQINTHIGFNFVDGLRALMRQDVDIIMVGEIRDTETVNLAIDSALTGHLVFSTIHTNSAAATVTRLLNMEIEPYLIASSLRMVIGQRLVRKLCSHCKKEIKLTPEKLNKINLKFKDFLQNPIDKYTFYKAEGCEKCNNTGYWGRIALCEVLLNSRTMKEFIIKNKTESEIETLSIQEGMISLKQDGLLKILEGITTIEEIEKHIDLLV